VNRWRWAALGVLVFGLAASLFLVPFEAACDDSGCNSTIGFQLMGIIGTLLITLVLFAIGAVDEPSGAV
jgi:hypothetical protein